MTTSPPPSQTPKLHDRTNAILRRLVRRDAGPALRKVIDRTRAEDLAAAMSHLTWSEQRKMYRAVEDPDKAAEILSLLPEDSVRQVASDLTEERLADVLDRLEVDDATDIVSLLPDDLRGRVLAEMDDEDGSELQELLAWPADSAGGIMATEAFTMPDTATCGAAIRALQRSDEDDYPYVHYVYVLDAFERLVGVVSLRNLVVRSPTTPLVAVMTRDPIVVGPRDDQEEVARYVARYDLLAIPVVDETRRLLGIVTVDDVVDVIREEAAEDLYKMAGLSDDIEVSRKAILVQVRQRGGWLLATVVGGIIAAEVVGVYETTLAKVAVLAGFIPVIMGMGGNVGIQSATVAVRGLATGAVQVGGSVPFVLRELTVGVTLGVLYGAILTAYGAFRFQDQLMIGASVGVSITLAISLASLLGASIPILFERLKVDPAVATGPMVTTLVDILAIVVYFNVASSLLGL